MPSYTTYVGRLDCPGFYWDDIPDEKYRIGNTPLPVHGLGPADRPLRGSLPRAAQKRVEAGIWELRPLDWGAWGIRVHKQDLEAMWLEEKAIMANDRFAYPDHWDDVAKRIAALESGVAYVLVREEDA